MQKLIAERFDGVQSRFAEAAGVRDTDVSRWFLAGEHGRQIGERVARRIEERLGLPKHTLDTDPEGKEAPPVKDLTDDPLRDKLIALFSALTPRQQQHYLAELQQVAEENAEVMRELGAKRSGGHRGRVDTNDSLPRTKL